MKWFQKLDLLVLTSFVFFTIGGLISHLLIFLREPQWNIRIIHRLSLGLAYDVMNAALLATIALLIGVLLNLRYRKIMHGLLYVLFLVFVFIDFNYVQQFGTHLPFSTIEYLSEASAFSSTIQSVLVSRHFWIITVIPFLLFTGLLRYAFRGSHHRDQKPKKAIITVVLLVLIGGISGSYPNSYVSKNLTDPLTSSPALFFFHTRDIEKEEIIQKPASALQFVQQRLTGQKTDDPRYTNLPLVRIFKADTCRNPEAQNQLGQSLCKVQKPNIIMLMLESFRAAEIGSYGSKIKITPEFDRLKGEGIFFEHFYANGFQTRHGQVASYCSIFPNYGAAIMKRYSKNNFLCLPQLLKQQDYGTSWIFASDAAFDDQISFLPKIGFDRIYDRFAFSGDAEVLGWGYSDRELFNKWLEILQQEKEPFFSSALTTTLHHPFDVPEAYKLHKGQDDLHKYYEAVYYTDAMLGEFIEKAKKTNWYKNTLIFIFADTSNYQHPQSPPGNFEEFVRMRTQIPLLILGGAVKKPLVINDYYSQVDMTPTVMDLLGKPYTSHWTGVSMLSNKFPAIAFTNRPGNYWAVMSRNGRYYNENNRLDHYFGFGDEIMKSEYKRLGQSWILATKWLLQENRYWIDN